MQNVLTWHNITDVFFSHYISFYYYILSIKTTERKYQESQKYTACNNGFSYHYIGVMSAVASQITRLPIVYSSVYSKRRSTKISKRRVTGLCEGDSTITGKFPAQMASNAKNVFIWWRHHIKWQLCEVPNWSCSYHRSKDLASQMVPIGKLESGNLAISM